MKKVVSLIMSMAMVASIFAGCSKTPATTETKSTGTATVAPKQGVKIKYVQDALKDEKVNAYFLKTFEEYKKVSGNEIDFEAIPADKYRTWLTTQFTAGAGPDVYYSILYDATVDYGKGWLYNFAEDIEKENKYFPGKKWKDTISPTLMERMYLSAKDVPGVPSITTVIRIFYNKDIFTKAGITKTPETWVEFLDAMKKIKAIGKVPFAFPNSSIADLSWLWFNNSIYNQLNSELVKEMDLNKNNMVELNEIARGVDEKIIDFTKPGFQEPLKLMKEFSQYWTKDYNALDGKTALQMFLRGDAAMMQTGSYDLKMIDELQGRGFEYGVMPVPVITKDTSAKAMGKSVVLGGQPDGIMVVNKSLKDDKLKAAIDFAQYMTSPDVQGKSAEQVYRIPSSISVKLPEKLKGFVITEEPLRVPYFTGVNEQIRTYFQRSGQQYLEGTITLEKYAETLNKAYADVLDTIKKENKWTKENEYGNKK